MNDVSGVRTWSVQVDTVDAGDVNIEPAFRVAIYENLLDELAKTKHFKQVLRQGDRNAGGVPDLLILKTTVQHYTPGSETRRAVTTVTGAGAERLHRRDVDLRIGEFACDLGDCPWPIVALDQKAALLLA